MRPKTDRRHKARSTSDPLARARKRDRARAKQRMRDRMDKEEIGR